MRPGSAAASNAPQTGAWHAAPLAKNAAARLLRPSPPVLMKDFSMTRSVFPVRLWAARFSSVAILGLTVVAWNGPAPAQENDPVVARVNGAEIRSSDVTAAEEELGTGLPPMTAEAKRDYIVTYLADTL